MLHIGTLFLSGPQKNQHLHASTLETLSFRSNFIDPDRVVSIQALWPYSDRCLFYGEQTQFTMQRLCHRHCLYSIFNGILSWCFYIFPPESEHKCHITPVTLNTSVYSRRYPEKHRRASLGKRNFHREVCSMVSIICWEADGRHLNCGAVCAFVSANCWLWGHLPPRL